MPDPERHVLFAYPTADQRTLPALQTGLPQADVSHMRSSVGRVVAVVGITTVTVCAATAAALALAHRQDDGTPVPTYGTALEMAQRAGCAATFHSVQAPAGVRSSGWCNVAGDTVAFRVQPSIDASNPWPTRRGGALEPNYVGNGWIVHSTDVHTLDSVGARLAP